MDKKNTELFTSRDNDQFPYGTREYGDIIVERDWIPSGRVQVELMYSKVYKKEAKHRANFLIIHGISEHGGRYLGIGKRLAQEDYISHIIDLTGYGLSGGGRAMGSFENLQDDIAVLFKNIKNDLPIFLFGHSMGGGLVVNFMMANPGLRLAGAILNAPFYRFPGKVRMNPIKLKIMKFLANAVPEIIIGSKLSPNSISKDKKFIAECFMDERLFVPYLTLAMVNTLIDITLPLKQKRIIVNAPILLMTGEKDTVCEFKYTQQFYEKIICPEKKIHTFPEGRHELHNDYEYPEWIKVMLNWAEHKLVSYKPEAQCSFVNLKHEPSFSGYYRWRNRLLQILIFVALFFYFRKKKWSLLKKILNL